MRRLALVAAVAGALGLAPAAHAQAPQTYTVDACGGVPNESWTVSKVSGVSVKATCATDSDLMFVQVDPGGPAVDHGTEAALSFGVPAGLQIVGWSIKRSWVLNGTPPSDFNRPYLLYSLDGQEFAGAGHWFDGQRQSLINQGAWANPPEGDVNAQGTIDKSTWATSAKLGGGQTLQARIGCAGSKNCKPGQGGLAQNGIKSASVVVQDTVAPSVSVAQDGLLAPGGHGGNDPIHVTAADASGISMVEVLDYSQDPTGQSPSNVVTYDDGTATGCQTTRVHACPDLSAQAIDPMLFTTGTYPVAVRVTDRAGNTATTPPFTVTVTEAAAAGPPNGDNATDGSTLTAGFGVKKLRKATSARFGSRKTVTGRLVNNAGAGIANASLVVSTKDKYGFAYEQRGTVKTGADGSFSVKLRTPASRTVLIGWRRFATDPKAAARVALKLQVRAAATIKKPKGVRRGRSFRVRGQVQGADPRKGVRLRVQAKVGKRWRIIGHGRAGKAGRFAIGARTSLGGTRPIRVQVRGRSDWPYDPGTSRVIRVRVR